GAGGGGAERVGLTARRTAGLLRVHADANAPLGGPASAFVGAGATVVNAPLAGRVVAPFDFATDRGSIVVVPGGTLVRAATGTVARHAGFAGDVAFHVARLPAAVPAADPQAPAGPPPAPVALPPDVAPPPGELAATLVATGAGFRATQDVTIVVAAARADGPQIASFTANADPVVVGERATLVPVFSGGTGTIDGIGDGIGAVASGAPVDTPAVRRTTTYTPTVAAADGQRAQAQVVVGVSYRDRFRTLVPAPVGRTAHVAAALPDGGALVMGGNATDSINVPDSDTSERFDPRTETFSAG